MDIPSLSISILHHTGRCVYKNIKKEKWLCQTGYAALDKKETPNG
jgi:hypothetical protein